MIAQEKAETRSIYVKAQIELKYNLCCVRRSKCVCTYLDTLNHNFTEHARRQLVTVHTSVAGNT
jgi:hypothetical protein